MDHELKTEGGMSHTSVLEVPSRSWWPIPAWIFPSSRHQTLSLSHLPNSLCVIPRVLRQGSSYGLHIVAKHCLVMSSEEPSNKSCPKLLSSRLHPLHSSKFPSWVCWRCFWTIHSESFLSLNSGSSFSQNIIPPFLCRLPGVHTKPSAESDPALL